MRRGAGPFLAILLCLRPGAAEALQVEVRRDAELYDVRGTTAHEVLVSLRTAGPEDRGRRFWGYTRSSVRWRFRWAASGRFCRITDALVLLDVRVTLPRWLDRGGADPALRARWDELLASLREHEDGHVEIAERGAHRVRRELLGTAGPCRGIERAANEAARRVWGRTRLEQQGYDEQTRQGWTQGVVWTGRAPADPVAGGEPGGDVATAEARERSNGRQVTASAAARPSLPPAELGSIPAEGPGEFLHLPERRRTMRLDRWTDRCPVLPWHGPRNMPSDVPIEATCEPVTARELGEAAGERWRAGLHRWRFVYGAEPGAPLAAGASFPDTVSELELVVVVEEGGNRGRPVWHDRVDARGATVELPTLVRRPDGAFLELRYCPEREGGCHQEHYRVEGPDAKAWTYVHPAYLEALEPELPPHLVARGAARVDLVALDAELPLFARDDPDPDPEATARLTLRLTRDALRLESVEIVAGTGRR